MKNLLLNNPITELWKDANSPIEYVVALWVTGLATLAVTGWIYLVSNFILNPSMFNNVSFGVFDYI